MKPWDLYSHIWSAEYNESGFDIDWKVEVDSEEKKVRLLFKPSDSDKDWLVNILGFLPVFKRPLFYTMGWKIAFDSVKLLIFEELLREINLHKGYGVEICGHSYGGAMSIDAGIELYRKAGIKADVITFGAPKPLFLLWSRFYARHCLNTVTQYRHKSDCITYLPPFIGYHNIKSDWLEKFSLKNLFKPWIYHAIYNDREIYGDKE